MWLARSSPFSSTIAIFMLRPTTMVSPAEFSNVWAFSNTTLPDWLASRKDCCPPCATPPMWKVRIVSWVPGSPIDWAAMMPTASPC